MQKALEEIRTAASDSAVLKVSDIIGSEPPYDIPHMYGQAFLSPEEAAKLRGMTAAPATTVAYIPSPELSPKY